MTSSRGKCIRVEKRKHDPAMQGSWTRGLHSQAGLLRSVAAGQLDGDLALFGLNRFQRRNEIDARGLQRGVDDIARLGRLAPATSNKQIR